MKKRLLATLLATALVCALAVPAGANDMGKAGEYNILSAGGWHTAAIDENGSLWTWGQNAHGQLGNGSTQDSTTPVKVMDNVAAVSCDGYHTAAIKTDGTLWMWGQNYYGQLGNGTTEGSNVPVKVLDNVAAVSCERDQTAAIKTDGTLWMWGANSIGQLGNGTTEGSNVPVKVLDNVAAVSCGRHHTAAIKTDGTLWMWGSNSDGQLGNGGVGNATYKDGFGSNYSYQTVPVKVLDKVAAVSCGSFYTAAIKTDGTLWMWGSNSDGQLGNGGGGNATSKDSFGRNYSYQTVPVKVLDKVAAVSCEGLNDTAVIKTDGTLWTWGYNSYGELGNGSTTQSKVPVKVLDNVATVSRGNYYTAAIKTDGTLWMWGWNNHGQLGNGGGGNAKDASGSPIQTVPIQITLGKGVSMPTGVRLYLNGGMGGGALWTDSTKTIKVPTNPTKEGYTFGGWYTDAALTIPWNFNDKVVNTLALYAKWVPVSSTATTTGKSKSTITLNGNTVTLDAYSLKADNGGDVTYVKLRDVAALLENTSVKFNVDWQRGAIYVSTKTAYTTKNGTELKAISGTNGSYKWNTAPVLFDGTTKALEGIVITDGTGGGHTFFKLRDLGTAIGITVDWSAERGIYIETK